MPFSHDRFDEHMKKIITQADYKNWLDIGAGAGKHGKMIRALIPYANITGVEIELDYINKYNLQDIYDTVRPINAMELMKSPTQTYEGIILGDVLEHLPKSQGVDLVSFLSYRCKLMIIVYPMGRIQNDYKDSSYEAHISVWTVCDFTNFDFTFEKRPESQLVIIDGFIEHEELDYDKP